MNGNVVQVIIFSIDNITEYNEACETFNKNCEKAAINLDLNREEAYYIEVNIVQSLEFTRKELENNSDNSWDHFDDYDNDYNDYEDDETWADAWENSAKTSKKKARVKTMLKVISYASTFIVGVTVGIVTAKKIKNWMKLQEMKQL